MNGTGRVEGKRTIVTGAGTGIGRATALLFAREGARVGLIGRREEKLREVADTIDSFGGTSLVLPCDVGSEEQVAATYDHAMTAWGGLDAVVAVAGIEPWGLPPGQGDERVDGLELEVWERIIHNNLTGMFLTLKYTVRAMLKTGGGAIVVTGSPTGLYGVALGENAYSASKAGCHGLARVVANEVARDGIRVNIVVPGLIDTQVNATIFQNPSELEAFCQQIPMRRGGSPEEVAGMNLWLCTSEASYCSGGEFVVDGGWTSI